MTTFIALYRGPSVQRAELVGVSNDAELVALVAGAMLRDRAVPPEDPPEDPASEALRSGRRRALRVIQTEAEGVLIGEGASNGC